MEHYTLRSIAVGTSHGFEVTVTADMMQTFAHITGDCNPLHVDAQFAGERGYRGPVVYGMLVASFYSTLVGVYLPGEHALLQQVEVSFRRPVYAGDRLTVSGEVTAIHAAVGRLEISAAIRNQDGERVSKAKIMAGIERE